MGISAQMGFCPPLLRSRKLGGVKKWLADPHKWAFARLALPLKLAFAHHSETSASKRGRKNGWQICLNAILPTILRAAVVEGEQIKVGETAKSESCQPFFILRKLKSQLIVGNFTKDVFSQPILILILGIRSGAFPCCLAGLLRGHYIST